MRSTNGPYFLFRVKLPQYHQRNAHSANISAVMGTNQPQN